MTSVPSSFQHPGRRRCSPSCRRGRRRRRRPPAACRRGSACPSGRRSWPSSLRSSAALVQSSPASAVELAGGDVDASSTATAPTIVLHAGARRRARRVRDRVVWWLATAPDARDVRPARAGAGAGARLDARPSTSPFWVAARSSSRCLRQARGPGHRHRDQGARTRWPLLVGFGVMTCVLAPLAEEFFFRGFLFRVLWERDQCRRGDRRHRRASSGSSTCRAATGAA